MSPEHSVIQRPLDAVRAAQHRSQTRAQQDGRRPHERRPHDGIPDGLHCEDVLLLVVLHHSGDPEAPALGVDADEGAVRLGAHLVPQPGVVRHGEKHGKGNQNQVQVAPPPLHVSIYIGICDLFNIDAVTIIVSFFSFFAASVQIGIGMGLEGDDDRGNGN